jgi:uncharacterized protein YndB with AHSA1/START domain
MAAVSKSASVAPDSTVMITRVFDAPREMVFRAWTDPKHLAAWWGPHGFTTPVCRIDARPGGAVRIDMRGPDGTVYENHGVVREIVPPERFIFTTAAIDTDGEVRLECLHTVSLKATGGKTMLTLKSNVIQARDDARLMIEGMQEGWTQSIERLAAYLDIP